MYLQSTSTVASELRHSLCIWSVCLIMFSVEEQDDFTPIASSKLASLFDNSSEQGNTSLTYTAPKQPKKGVPEKRSPVHQTTTQPFKLSIIIVKAVQTFKLEDGSYNGQGKLGAAVLGNTSSCLFQLLLYKNKQQQITTTKITEQFQFTVQPNKFASFYDDQRQNWSIMFDSEQDGIDFAKEVGLARANARGDKEVQPFYVQDLKTGMGPPAEQGDLLDICYSTSSLLNCNLGQEIDSNWDAEKPETVKVRKGVWAEALLGATKGCRKLIVLASVLFGPWKPRALLNSRLVVEVEVIQIKKLKGSRESTPTGLRQTTESSESNVDSSTDETSIKARGASISEALTNSPKTYKASIISRMAKMGQPTLPLKGAVACNPSDSEETEEESICVSGDDSSVTSRSTTKTRNTTLKLRTPSLSHVSRLTAKPEMALPHRNANVVSNSPTQQLAVFPSYINWQQQHHHHQQQQQQQQQQYVVNSMPFSVASQYPCFTSADSHVYTAMTQPAGVSQQFSSPVSLGTPVSGIQPESQLTMFMSESRSQNTELRMGISKIIDKVDQVMAKVDGLHVQQSVAPSSFGPLEPMTLLISIQKLVSDNELLQAEVNDKRIKLEQQNEKMFHLLQANQKFLEKSSCKLEQRIDIPLQAVIHTEQQEKVKLAAELSEAVPKANSLQCQANKFESTGSELSVEVNSVTNQLQEDLESCKTTIFEQEKKLHGLKEDLKLSVQLCQTQENTIVCLQESVKKLEATKTSLEKSLSEAKQQMEQSKKETSDMFVAMTTAHKKQVDEFNRQLETVHSQGDIVHNRERQIEQVNNKSSIILTLEEEKLRLKEKLCQLEAQVSELSSRNLHPSFKEEDVKRIMNVMFKLLKSEFVPGASYEGNVIRHILLSTIKNVTLQYVNLKISSRNQMKLEKPHPNDQNELHLHTENAYKPAGNDPSCTKPSFRNQEEKNQETGDAVRKSPELKPEMAAMELRESLSHRDWRLQPPSPLFDEDEYDNDDDWLS